MRIQPRYSFDFGICIALIMNCQNIKKELSATFLPPKINTFALLSYTQFFICYYKVVSFSVLIGLCFFGYCLLNDNFAVLNFASHFSPHFGQCISIVEPSPAFNNLYPQSGHTTYEIICKYALRLFSRVYFTIPIPSKYRGFVIIAVNALHIANIKIMVANLDKLFQSAYYRQTTVLGYFNFAVR